MNKFKTGIVQIFIANSLNMVISLLTSFLLPKFLSVESYAGIKTFQLYVGIVGVFAFGYIDGMFLEFGGKELCNIDKKDLELDLSTFRIYQALIMGLTIIIAILTKDFAFIAFSICILPLNVTGYFKSFYQAVGEFKRYSNLMNITTVITFVVNMTLLFVFRIDLYHIYLVLYVIIYIFVWILLEVTFRKQNRYNFSFLRFSSKTVFDNVKEGILLMLGNFANMLLTSMDRWFIKALMTTVDFAQYSFACSMESMVNVAVTPITVTLYNYFCKEKDGNKITLLRNYMTIIAVFFVSCAFAGKFMLEIFLTNYIEATKAMFFLFAAQIFYIVIKSIYVNLYKSMKMQRTYFIKLVVVIVSGAIFNIIAYLLLHTKESFAIGTLLTAIEWFILSSMDFKSLKKDAKYIIYLIISTAVFLLLGSYCNAILGFLLYIILECFLSILLMKNDFSFLLKYFFGTFLKYVNKIINKKDE